MTKLSINSRDVNYREHGVGSPIVFLHGYGGSHLDWDLVANEFAKDHHVFLPNFSSHYLDLKNKLNFHNLVDLVSGFLLEVQKRTGQKVILAGSSFGAALAWAVAIRQPEALAQLVLVSPMPPNPSIRLRDPKLKFLLRLANVPTGVALFLATPIGRLLVPYLERIFQLPWAKGKKRQRFAFLTHRKVRIISHSVERFAWIIKNEDWLFWESRLHLIEHPTLILCGDHDTLFRSDEPERFVRCFKNAHLSPIIGGGHAMTREAPNSILREMRRFLESEQRAAPGESRPKSHSSY